MDSSRMLIVERVRQSSERESRDFFYKNSQYSLSIDVGSCIVCSCFLGGLGL